MVTQQVQSVHIRQAQIEQHRSERPLLRDQAQGILAGLGDDSLETGFFQMGGAGNRLNRDIFHHQNTRARHRPLRPRKCSLQRRNMVTGRPCIFA
jgi:hypothetical protein